MDSMITALLKERDMSLTELTERLGYQSKTSLVRIMKNQANQRALDTFAKRLNERMNLTEEEQERLAVVMEHLRWQDDYDSSQEMLRFLRGESKEDEEIWLETADGGEKTLLAQRYDDASDIRITLINCQYVSIFQMLLRLVQKNDATVEHFMLMRKESARVIRALHVLTPLIFERNYTGYSYRKSEFGQYKGVMGVLSGDLMTVSYRTSEGMLMEDMIVFDRAGHGFVQTLPMSGIFLRMLGLKKEEYEPIKRIYSQNMQLEDYVNLCGEYAKIEHNRAILKIKPDVCMTCIPEDILMSALLEGGFPEIQLAGRALLERFCQIHKERVRNIFEKRRVTRMIMKRSAMVRFARTGRMGDHVWAMRAFTKDERVRILTLLLDHMENNPYFNVSFLKDNDYLRDMELLYYEGEGLLVSKANTDYSTEGNHSEVMLVHDGFTRMFKEYFERSLLPEHVMTHAESLGFMNELIRIAGMEG